jgi:serine/threonine protein kinase
MLLDDFASELESETEDLSLDLEDLLLKHPQITYTRMRELKQISERSGSKDLETFLEANGVISSKSRLKLNLILQGLVPVNTQQVEAVIDADALQETLLHQNDSRPLTYPEVGSMLGKYLLESVLGEGATSRVYKSRHPLLQNTVALKVLSPLLAARSSLARERFIKEGINNAHLIHPSLTQIMDAVETPEHVYLVMECVDGKSLQYIMERQGALPLHHVLVIIGQICQSLEYIHDQGLIHRDIKPENIMLNISGRVKLLDLGIAVEKGAKATESSVYGSPYYMSPEHLENQAEVRSDIYSLGVVLYALSTGELPFLSDNLEELMRLKKEHNAINPCEINPELPPSIGALTLQMMARNPSDRPENCAVLLEQLGLILAREILPGSRTPVAAMREFLGV